MKKEKEITVIVNVSYEKLKEELKQNNFVKKEEYIVNDSYLINSLINITDMKKFRYTQEMCFSKRYSWNFKTVII